jgi:hypothetical protein
MSAADSILARDEESRFLALLGMTSLNGGLGRLLVTSPVTRIHFYP